MEKLKYWKFAIWFLVVILVVGGGAMVYRGYFSEEGQAARLAKEQIDVYEKAEAEYIAAMTADTYGGATPQETLDLFVEALRAGDVDLASKYFLLDENLSRTKWINYLIGVEDQGLLGQMAKDIDTRSLVDEENIIDKNDYKFVLRDNEGNVGARIDMRLNSYSGLWKIESL